jgi:hypothetical protein
MQQNAPFFVLLKKKIQAIGKLLLAHLAFGQVSFCHQVSSVICR